MVSQSLQYFDIPCRERGRIRCNGDLGQPVARLEALKHRDDRLDFRAVAFKALNLKREARAVDQQADRDLRFEPPLFRKPRLPVIVLFFYLEI